MASNEGVSTIDHARAHVDFLLNNSPLYSHLFQGIEIDSASPSRVLCSLRLEAIHLNSKGSLHGSCSATLIDFMGGLAIACFDNRANTGVSTDMHISFVGGAKAGDVLDVEGKVDKCGGTLAFTTVTIRKQADGQAQGEGPLVGTGSHTKFVKQR